MHHKSCHQGCHQGFERRRSARARVDGRARCRHGMREAVGRVVELSVGGVVAQCGRPIADGKALQRIELVLDDGTALAAVARTVWYRDDRIGLRLIGLSDADRLDLAERLDVADRGATVRRTRRRAA